MLKADTKSLEQQVNLNYINLIRLQELQYYSSFYLTFGGKAAILGGFSFAAITQINFNNFCNPLAEGQTFYPGGGSAAPTPAPTRDFVTIITNEVNSCQGKNAVFYITVQDLFWIAQAVTMALAFRVMAQSILLVTVGPLKAFSGKKGSIVSVIQEFEANKHSLFRSFAFMIIGFLSSILGFIYIGLRNLPVLFQYIIASCFLGFMFLLYYKSYHSYKMFEHVVDNKNIFLFTLEILKSLLDIRLWIYTPDSLKTTHFANVNDQLKNLEINIKNENKITLKATGFMQKKPVGQQMKIWKERFFILIENEWGNLELFYYKDEYAFISDPEHPIKERPIQLNNYEINIVRISKAKVDITILFELKPAKDKIIERIWILEVGDKEPIWKLICKNYGISDIDEYLKNQNNSNIQNLETNHDPNPNPNSTRNPLLVPRQQGLHHRV